MKLKLKHIKIDPTGLCNLTCSFCPRGNEYPNINEHMTIETIDKILSDLEEFNEPFLIDVCGHGEPTLGKNFKYMVHRLAEYRDRRDGVRLQLFSNGARFKRYKNELKLFDYIAYDLYTDDEDIFWEAVKEYKDIRGAINMVNSLGKNVLQFKEGGMIEPRSWIFFNQAGSAKLPAGTIDEPHPDFGFCIRPFQDINIGHNGDYALCCDDWSRQSLGNIHDESLKEFWLNNEIYNNYRFGLERGIRDNLCKKCDYPGHNHYIEQITDGLPISPVWQENVNKRLEAARKIPDFPEVQS